MIIAKFSCTDIHAAPDGENVYMSAVYTSDPDDPNHSWSKWTPSGRLEMMITNPTARGRFVKGREYMLRFEDANPNLETCIDPATEPTKRD